MNPSQGPTKATESIQDYLGVPWSGKRSTKPYTLLIEEPEILHVQVHGKLGPERGLRNLIELLYTLLALVGG